MERQQEEREPDNRGYVVLVTSPHGAIWLDSRYEEDTAEILPTIAAAENFVSLYTAKYGPKYGHQICRLVPID